VQDFSILEGLGESSFHRPTGRNRVLSLFDHAAHFGLEVYDKRSDNVSDLKFVILHVNFNFSNTTNRAQPSQPMVQSLCGTGSILPNAFSGL
jgi:hypothetical protein